MTSTSDEDLARREFHVSRRARDTYRFDQTIFASSGNVVFPNFHAARVFAQRMNERRDLVSFPEQAVRAGEINAMGLIDEVMHLVVARHREQVDPKLMGEARAALEARLGAGRVAELLATFTDAFPPVAVYRQEETVEGYLAGSTGGVDHRDVALEELLMLWLANSNPAFARHLELFDHTALTKTTVYLDAMAALEEHFAARPGLGGGGERGGLIAMLRAPALASPHSVEGQLEFIRRTWGELLGPTLYRVLTSLDLIAEESKPFFGFGPGPVEPYEFRDDEEAGENYSPDRDWMPRLVLMAKNAWVWLHQLGERFGRDITRLDQVPDEELDQLARWGVTGLWLIGVWQRSRASERIKRRMGD